MENNTKFCSTCGKQIPADAQFCTVCGAPQTTVQSVETATEESAPAAEAAPAQETSSKGSANSFLSKILSPLIVATIALIMMICAFLPIFKVTTGDDKEDPSYKVSAMNVASFMLDSFKSLSDEDIADSNLYSKFEDKYVDFRDAMSDFDADDYDSYDELPGRVKRLYNDLFIIQARMQLQSEETKTTLALVVAGLVALLYVAASVAFFVFALIKLIPALTTKEDGEAAAGGLPQNKLNMIFLAVPALLALLYFSGSMAFATLGISSSNLGVSGAATFNFVVVFIAICASIAFDIIFDVKAFLKAVKENLMKLIGVGAALALSVAMLIALSSPVLSASVSAKFGGRNSEKKVNIPLDTSYFAGLGMTDEEREYADKAFDSNEDVKEYSVENLFDDFEDYTTTEIKNGKANSDNEYFVKRVSIYSGLYKVNFFFGFISLLYIAAFAFAAYGVWYNLVAVMNGKKSGPSFNLACAIVVAVAAFLALVFAVVFNGAVKGFGIRDYSLGLSFGAICAILFAVGAKVCNTVFGKLAAKADCEALAAEAAPAGEAPVAAPAEETPVSETSSEEENA